MLIGCACFSLSVICSTADQTELWCAAETKSVGRVIPRQTFHRFTYATLRYDARIIAMLRVKCHYAHNVTARYRACSAMTFHRSVAVPWRRETNDSDVSRLSWSHILKITLTMLFYLLRSQYTRVSQVSNSTTIWPCFTYICMRVCVCTNM